MLFCIAKEARSLCAEIQSPGTSVNSFGSGLFSPIFKVSTAFNIIKQQKALSAVFSCPFQRISEVRIFYYVPYYFFMK